MGERAEMISDLVRSIERYNPNHCDTFAQFTLEMVRRGSGGAVVLWYCGTVVLCSLYVVGVIMNIVLRSAPATPLTWRSARPS